MQIDFKNNLSELARLAAMIEDFGQQCQLPARMVFNINLVLDELVTNIVNYGYDDGQEHAITVRLSMNDGEFMAQLEDDARPFNPLTLPEPDLTLSIEDRPIGGLGIHFARTIMDTLEYKRVQGRNLLVMKKQKAAE